MRYLLAHDLGTSGNKATVFSEEGKLIASRTYEYPLYTEHDLWAEQDADDWWHAVCDSTKELIEAVGIQASSIAAVSFSGQMMGCLPVDRQGTPLRKAMIWADRRAQIQSDQLSEKVPQEDFYRIVGHRNTASYGIQKAMWIRDNQPETYEKTYKFLNAKDYIVLRMTGIFCTDVTDANSMGCLDLAKREWSERIIEASGIDPDKLPEIKESVCHVGNLTARAAAETGLREGLAVIMGAGDGLAANIGAGSVAPGQAYCCLGTSAWVASTSETPVLDEGRRIICWAHAVPGLYSPNGTMQYAGGSYSWLKNVICTEEIEKARELGKSVYELINEEINNSEPGAGGLIFLPYLMGERAPRWNPHAKGIWYGITSETRRCDLLRSVMEGVLINLGICFDVLKGCKEPRKMMLIGGVARSPEWQQTAADVFGTSIMVPRYLEEANSMGAAIIAGVGSGIYKDFSVVDRFIDVREEKACNASNHHLYEQLQQKTNVLYEATKDLSI
jgi:xylulokinase